MASVFIIQIQILLTLLLLQKCYTTQVVNTFDNESTSIKDDNFTDIINFIFRYNETKVNDVFYTTPSNQETTETDTTDDYNATTTEVYILDLENRVRSSPALVASLLG